MITAEPNVNALEVILKEHLVKEVKDRLHKIIDTEIEDIARNAVVKFLKFQIDKDQSGITFSDTYLFKFVQNITKTVVNNIVVKESK